MRGTLNWCQRQAVPGSARYLGLEVYVCPTPSPKGKGGDNDGGGGGGS